MSAARPEPSLEPPIERWLRSHADAVALLLVGLGLMARLRAAHGAFFTPDEALHLRIAASRSLWETYRGSLGNAHPPLFLFLLHGWQRIAQSDWQLRLLPVACGTGFLWFAYRWAVSAFGQACGLVTLAYLSFLPSVVLISSELRAYALLLCLIAAALVALERAWATGSASWLWLSSGLTALAILTHYAAFRFAAAVFAYAAARMLIERRPRRFVAVWMAGQAALLALAAFLIVSHVASLRGSPLEREVQRTWLRESYWLGSESAPRFLVRQTLALFQYLFSSPAAGAVALVLFLGGTAWLASRRSAKAILLAAPFLVAAAGGLLAIYPYGGTRHSVDLSLFACAGAGIALARLAGERLWVAIAVAGVLVAAGFVVSG